MNKNVPCGASLNLHINENDKGKYETKNNLIFKTIIRIEKLVNKNKANKNYLR